MATLNKSMGAHSLRTGMEFRPLPRDVRVLRQQPDRAVQLRLDLDARPARQLRRRAPDSLGQSFASFLLGLPASGSVARAAELRRGVVDVGLLRAGRLEGRRSRLTLNLGLRYEYETPLVEADNRSVRGFDAGAAQPMEAAARARAQSGGHRRAARPVPRPGRPDVRRAWTASRADSTRRRRTTSCRALGGDLQARRQDRRCAAATACSTASSASAAATSSRPGSARRPRMVPSPRQRADVHRDAVESVPGRHPGAAGRRAGHRRRSSARASRSSIPNPKSPRMQRWQVGIQRELPGQLVAEASYVGNRGSHIQTTRNLNATPLQYLSTSPVRDQATIDYLSATVPNPFFGLMPVDRGDGLPRRDDRPRAAAASRIRSSTPSTPRPTRASPGITRCRRACRSASRRATRSALNYTYSRFEEATEFLNGADPAPCKDDLEPGRAAPASVSGICEMPFGRGRRVRRATLNRPLDVADRRLAVPGDLHLPDADSRSGTSATCSSPATSTTSRCPPTSGRSRAGSTPTPGSTRSPAQQLGSNVRTFPLRLDSVRDRRRQQRRPVGDQERRRSAGGGRCSSGSNR